MGYLPAGAAFVRRRGAGDGISAAGGSPAVAASTSGKRLGAGLVPVQGGLIAAELFHKLRPLRTLLFLGRPRPNRAMMFREHDAVAARPEGGSDALSVCRVFVESSGRFLGLDA
jgi:hypothetical protein